MGKFVRPNHTHQNKITIKVANLAEGLAEY